MSDETERLQAEVDRLHAEWQHAARNGLTTRTRAHRRYLEAVEARDEASGFVMRGWEYNPNLETVLTR